MEGKQRVSLGLVVILVLTLTILGCSTANETQTDRPIESDEGKKENGAQTEHLVAASQFPEKNIELLVIVGPGGSVDATARILSEGASEYLPNQSEIVVVNRPGGSGSVALTSLLNSEPDGYTLAIAGPSEIVTNYLLGTAQYTPDDFEYVLNAIATPLILVDREDSPWQSYQEWVEYVKNHPGEVRVGIVGKTSLGPLILQRLITAANLDFVLVPYEQGGPALAAMLAGELDGVLLSQATIRDVEGVRPLFTIAPERVQSLPDVPSINEHSGVDENLGTFSPLGIVAPKGVPQEILTIIHDAYKAALEDPDVVQKLNELGIEPKYLPPEEYKNSIMEDQVMLKEILEELDLVNE